MKIDRYEFGISTLGCPNLNLKEVAALAQTYHIGKLSLRTLEGSCNLVPILQRPEEQKMLSELCQKQLIFSLDSGFCLCKLESSITDLRQLATIADRFGIQYLRIFGGIEMTDAITPEVVAIALAHLKTFDAGNFQCQLILETHDGFSSGQRCRELFTKLGRELPVLWDTEHTYFTGGETFAQSYACFDRLLVGFHLKDCVKQNGKLLAKLPGEGKFPFQEWLQFLQQQQINVPVIFEYEKMWQPEIPPLEVALQKLLDHNWCQA